LFYILTVCHLSAKAEDRSLDGTGNNLLNPAWGSAGTVYARRSPAAYGDGQSAIDATLPNPRVVGNALFNQDELKPSANRLSGFVYAFGQLITHDMQETVSGDEEFVFLIPEDDPLFFPAEVAMTRSLFDPATGNSPDNPRQQINFTSSFLDGSVIYSSDPERASMLRGGPAQPGAKLRTSSDINGDGQNLLPRDAFGPNPAAEFVAGDNRVNDNVILTAMQAVFMREHNRLVDELIATHPQWTADQLYERARKLVGAQLQVVTYKELLPALLGPHAPSIEGVYDPDVDPSILNEFATVCLRLGHSMLTPDFKRIANDGRRLESIELIDAFSNPSLLNTSAELDLLLKGLSLEVQEEVDLGLVDGMRFALLDAFDLSRARDHGLADYNTMREAFGLPRVTSFAEINSDETVQAKLEAVYGDVDSIEPFAGVLAEEHLPGANVGPLAAAVFSDQFTRLRDGDRFWFTNDEQLADDRSWLMNQTLADIIGRNTGATGLQENVFMVPEPATLNMLVGMLWLRRRKRVSSSPVGTRCPKGG
jgi:hypothetical protein